MIGGTVINANDGFNPCDFNIDLEVNHGNLGNYQGLSGAPLIIGEKICGIITYQNGLKLKAIEFNRFKEYIESLNLEFMLHNSNENVSNIEIQYSEIIDYQFTVVALKHIMTSYGPEFRKVLISYIGFHI